MQYTVDSTGFDTTTTSGLIVHNFFSKLRVQVKKQCLTVFHKETMNQQWRRSRRRNEGPSVGSMVSAAVFAYGSYKLASWAWNSWNVDEEDDREEGRQQQCEGYFREGAASGGRPMESVGQSPMTPHRWRARRQRMMRCRDEALKALESFLPTLRKAIEDKTNTTSEGQALKQLRVQRNNDPVEEDEMRLRETERELWETIKVRAVTRMVATAYAHSVLFLVVTVQVNLLGGKLFEEQVQNTSSTSSMSLDSVASDRMAAYGESHKLVLQHTYKYFFEQGIVSLVDSVERAVTAVFENWNVSDPSSLNISRESFEEAINEIRVIEEQRGRASTRSKRRRSLLRFLMPPSESFDEIVTDELARWILDETWDLLESPVLLDAQHDCLKATFDRMKDQHWGKMFDNDNDAAEMPRYAADRSVTRPLAHVVTRLKHTSKSFFKSQQSSSFPDDQYNLGLAAPRFTINSYCAEMELLPSILELADVSFN